MNFAINNEKNWFLPPLSPYSTSHPYLYGRRFKNPEGQIARWLGSLQQYDFQVEHRAGLKHGNADALSRRPCAEGGCRHCESLESKDSSKEELEQPEGIDAMQGRELLPVASTSIQPNTPRTVSPSVGQQDFAWTLAELRQAQLEDPDLAPISQCFSDSDVRPPWAAVAPAGEATKVYWAQWDSLRLQDGVLYRVWETPAGDQHMLQLVLPKKLRPFVLQQLHSTPTGGHFGVAKTLGKVRERFYWVTCRADVQQWCRTCDLCSSRKGPPKRIRAPMGQYNVGSPMERVAVDVLGPLPETDAGNKYLLLAVDYFSKWPEAFPLPNQEAQTVAEVLVHEMICRFGVPLQIHSDQGRNFESTVFSEMCRLLGIKKTRTTPLHPQGDGVVERLNRTLEAQLSKFVDDHQRDWDRLVPLMIMAYRTAEHDTTGYSPAKVMMGHNLRLPMDLIYERPDGEVLEHQSSFAENLQSRLEQVHHFVRGHIKGKSDKMVYYDSQVEGEGLEVGDAVWLYSPQRKKGISPKLTRPWQGPYVVITRLNDLVYRIRLGPRSKAKVVHRNRLWKYRGQDPPTWFTTAETQDVEDEGHTNDSTADATASTEDSQVDSEEAQLPPTRQSGRLRRPPSRYQA